MPLHTITYNKGIDRDSSKHKYPEGCYYKLKNMRITSFEQLSNGAVNSMNGNVVAIAAPGGYDTHVIIGLKVIRNYLVAFSTADNSATGGLGTIWRATLNSTTPTWTKVYESASLYFSAQHPIADEAIGYYESPTRIKVYWTDGYNMIRHINIAGSSFPLTLNVDKLNIVPNTTFVKPVAYNVVGGNLYVGKVQYAYQYFNIGGIETMFSPCTGLIHLSPSNDKLTGSNMRLYAGASALNASGNPQNSGKGVVVKLTGLDTSYDKIRVVSIHYKNIDQDPTISVIGEYVIASTLSITDTGTYSLGTISLNALRTLGNAELYCKTIAQKGNKAVIGNITEKYFDIDFDARAYRYGPYDAGGGVIGKRIFVYNSLSNANEEIISDGVAWPNTSYTMVIGGVSVPVPETHDCINPFNYDFKYPGGATIDEEAANPTYYGAAGLVNNPATARPYSHNQYMWQSDINAVSGIGTIGGEGPHVKYDIVFTDFIMDEATSCKYVQPGTTVINDFTSYADYKNPLMTELNMSFKRDEVYRFGLKFHDAKGNVSFVKWVGDIKMPHGSSVAGGTVVAAWTALGKHYGRRMTVRFYVDVTTAIAQGAVGMEIVVVKREEKDRTILTQGILSRMAYDNAVGKKRHSVMPFPVIKDGCYGLAAGIYYLHTNTLQLASPEISYFKNIECQNTDYIKLAGKLGGGSYRKTHWTHNTASVDNIAASVEQAFLNLVYETNGLRMITKYNGMSPILNPTTFRVEGGTIAGTVEKGGEDENLAYLAGESFPVLNRVVDYTAAGVQRHEGISGTSLLINSARVIIDTELADATDKYETYLVDYKRPGIAASQYGGITYNARQASEYIATGTYTDISGGGVKQVSCNGGDTFIVIYEHLRTMYEVDDNDGDTNPDVLKDYRIGSVVYFPCETVINTNLDHGDKFSRTFDWGIKEVAGTYYNQSTDDVLDETTSSKYIQEKDMYQYNTAYSQQNTTFISYPKPDDFETEVAVDTLVKMSLEKTPGEDVDGYLKFLTDNEKLLPTDNGPLNKLYLYKNFMLAFFDTAIGSISIDERAILPINNNSLLELGAGEDLRHFDYVANKSGSIHPQSVCESDAGFMWYDALRGLFGLYDGNTRDIGFIKSISSDIKTYTSRITSYANSFYNNPFKGGNVLCYENPKHKEVICAFTVSELAAYASKNATSVTFTLAYPCGNFNDAKVVINGVEYIAHTVTSVAGAGTLVINTTDNPTLDPTSGIWAAGWYLIYYKDLSTAFAFSSLNGSFILEADIFPTWMFTYNDNLYDIFGKFATYKENEGDYGHFYGQYRKGEQELIVNPRGSMVCVFNNYEYGMEALVSGANSLTETWDTARFSNDYQWGAGVGVSCTFTTGTNLITQNAHGYVTGDRVMFSGASIPAQLSNSIMYYVINPTVNTFQVSASMNGTPIAMASGSGLCHPIDIPLVVGGNLTNDKRRIRTWRMKDMRDMKGYVAAALRPRMRDAYIRILFKYQHAAGRRLIMHDLYVYYTPTREALGNM